MLFTYHFNVVSVFGMHKCCVIFRYGHIVACVAICGGYWVLRTLRAKILQRRGQSLAAPEPVPREESTASSHAIVHDVVVSLVDGAFEAALASPSTTVVIAV